jgi:hypothetical protein
MNLLVYIYLDKDIKKTVINNIKVILNFIEIKLILYIKNFEGIIKFIKFSFY